MANYYTKLAGGRGTFDNMMKHGFGVVTVMNAHVYDALRIDSYKDQTAYQIAKAYGEGGSEAKNALCVLDTLKIANVTEEGPSKTIMGGQFSNPLIKFGKSARLEMQDALGKGSAIEALCGGIVEQKTDSSGPVVGLHSGEDFAGPKLIVGDSFFIDRDSGEQVKVRIVFYQFLPDSIMNLTQDAEGDATVFDMNGDLLTTEILVGNKAGQDNVTHGVFYSIVDPQEAVDYVKSYKGDSIDAVQKMVNTDAELLDAGQQLQITAPNFKKGVPTKVTIESITFTGKNVAAVVCTPALTADAA